MNEEAGTASSRSIWSCAILVVRYSGGFLLGWFFGERTRRE